MNIVGKAVKNLLSRFLFQTPPAPRPAPGKAFIAKMTRQQRRRLAREYAKALTQRVR